MVYFVRIEVYEGISVNNTSATEDCEISHYWCFLNFSFRFKPNVFNRCHDLLMISMNLSYIAILYIKGSGYCCIISLIIKTETIKLL